MIDIVGIDFGISRGGLRKTTPTPCIHIYQRTDFKPKTGCNFFFKVKFGSKGGLLWQVIRS
jgi:hypothetical protein